MHNILSNKCYLFRTHSCAIFRGLFGLFVVLRSWGHFGGGWCGIGFMFADGAHIGSLGSKGGLVTRVESGPYPLPHRTLDPPPATPISLSPTLAAITILGAA